MPKYRRDNVYLECNGKTQTVTEWAEELGVKRQTIQRRLELGWDVWDALFTPVRDNTKPRGTQRG